jgi:hypothetical protein
VIKSLPNAGYNGEPGMAGQGGGAGFVKCSAFGTLFSVVVAVVVISRKPNNGSRIFFFSFFFFGFLFFCTGV